MAKVSPAHHGRMAFNGVKAALRNWSRPKTPLLDAPPSITAKQALHLTRAAVADGVAVDESVYANAT
jgi:hypothetical protein